MEILVRIAEALGRFSARYVPGSFAIAVLLSLLNPFAALIPFVDTGAPDSAENANKTGCYDLAARSKAQREKN